jgi:chemotaxis signal transduction protein
MQGPVEQALMFVVANETFALPLPSIVEVQRAAWPIRIPRAPFGCLGLLDIRGAVVPLLDLGVTLGLRGPAREEGVLSDRLYNGHVLVIETEGLFGLLVDRVLDVSEVNREIPSKKKGSAPDALELSASLFVGTAVLGKTRAPVLKPDAIIGIKRRRMLRRAADRSENGR